ncbi:MAG: glycosyltransferase family 39 protein, partial [Gemmatimonadota bacterium]
MSGKIVWLLFAAAFLARAILVLTRPDTGDTFHDEPGQVAIALSQGNGFADPYVVPTGPTAHVAPVVPLLLAFFIKIFGSTDSAWIASQLVSCLVAAGYAALLLVVAPRVGLRWPTGLIAATLAAVPLFLWTETNGKFETIYILAALTLLVALTSSRLVRYAKGDDTGGWAGLGVAWGLGLLISPTLILPLLAMVGLSLISRMNGIQRLSLRPASILVATAVAVVLPYSIERSIRIGGPVFVRSNLGLELFISNNDEAYATYNANMASRRVLHRWHPMAVRAEALRVRAMGEGPYHTDMRRRATEWIRAHPAAFGRLTLGRIKEFWFPASPSTVKVAFLGGLSIAGISWLV